MKRDLNSQAATTSGINLKLYLTLLLVVSGNTQAYEEGSNADIAQDLQNPIADLMTFPFQFNYAENLGPDDKGERYLLNIQPVIPFDLNDDSLIISRTILPVVRVEDVFPDGTKEGLGDIVQSFFYSPKATTANGWTWGAGPVLLLPTATEDELGTEKWGIGPTAVALKQQGGWTYGMLANHIWDYAGDDDRSDVNQTFLQPFVGYAWPNAVSVFLTSESIIDWEDDEETVPINFVTSRVIPLGGQIFSFGAGLTYWADSPDNGPEDFGVRLTVTWIVPR